MLLSIIIISALLLDAVIGEPRRWHPLVGFGNLAIWVEQKMNNKNSQYNVRLRLSGLFAWAFVVLPFVVGVYFLEQFSRTYQFELGTEIQIGLDVFVSIIFLMIAIGAKSLMQHASDVACALNENNINLARQRIAMIVSRDTRKSDEAAITRATIESVLENGSDAIFAAIFWFVVLGAPGVVLYRLANTLDAMWGYRTERYHYFGWAAARIDDVMNWVPARLTALSYALAGNTRSALRCWFTQARRWHGINPGVVMASGAGALQIKLGGKAFYHGQAIERADLGLGNTAETNDIERALQIVQRSIVIWVLAIVVISSINSTF